MTVVVWTGKIKTSLLMPFPFISFEAAALDVVGG